VIAEGALMAAIGVLVGGIGGYILAKLVGSYVMDIRMPSLLPVIVSAAVLLSAAVIASAWPASRAARIDVMEALRSD
jgi:putative ABC transport system permease protein